MCVCVCVCVCSIMAMAMHPEGMGRCYALAHTSPVQKTNSAGRKGRQHGSMAILRQARAAYCVRNMLVGLRLMHVCTVGICMHRLVVGRRWQRLSSSPRTLATTTCTAYHTCPALRAVRGRGRFSNSARHHLFADMERLQDEDSDRIRTLHKRKVVHVQPTAF